LRLLEVRPIGLCEKLDRQLELVEEWQALHRVGCRRLMLHDGPHVPQSPPGKVWGEKTSHLADLQPSDLGDQGMDVRLETLLIALGTPEPRFPVPEPRANHSR
jgi:hypothetical protein